MSEIIRIGIEGEEELRALMDLMDAAIAKKDKVMGVSAQPLVAKIPELSRDIDKILLEAGGLDAILLRVEETKAGLEDVDDMADGLKLPTIDRGTRMILLRIPGLREAMRLLYQIKMMQRTLKLGELRGPVTAGILAAMYAYMALEAMQKRQDRLEARMSDFEKTFTRRYITMEEAVHGLGVLPQRYRSTVPP